MKAINFIEFHCNSFNKCEAGEITIQEHYNQMEDAGVFYSQLFKPELIEKYFEGWETKDFPDNSIYYNWGEPFLGAVFNFNKHSKVVKILKDKTYLLKVKTLDQFITDCQRAGIELSFNKTALQELPL